MVSNFRKFVKLFLGNYLIILYLITTKNQIKVQKLTFPYCYTLLIYQKISKVIFQ